MYPVIHDLIQLQNFLNGVGQLILDVIPEIVGSLIGVWGAIKLFMRQTNQEKKEEKKSVKTEQEEILRYSSILAQSAIITYKKESEILEKYANNVINNPHSAPKPLAVFATNDVNRLVNILNGKDYLHTYLNNLGNNQKSLEEFGSISKCIDYLEISRNQIEAIGNKAAIEDYERRVNYTNIVLRNLNQIKDHAYNNILNMLDILEVLVPHRIVFGNDENLSIVQHLNMTVLPIMYLISNKYHSDSEAKKIEFELMEAVEIVNHVIHHNRRYGQDLLKLKEDLETTIKSFELNLTRLKDYTIDNKR